MQTSLKPRKVLFLPLLQMSSGHHRVADALSTALQQYDPTIVCKKIDILTETSPTLEHLITTTYLKWINISPKSYKTIYRYFAEPKANQVSSDQMALIRQLFKRRLLHIVEAEQPDLLICTHGFPSSILNDLKKKKKITTPVVNVYTDFFINHIWGKEYIDYHLVADHELKQHLFQHFALHGTVLVSGIPVDPRFKRKIKTHTKAKQHLEILVAGGSNGLFEIQPFLSTSDNITYKVLCGTNKQLYHELRQANYLHIEPLPYIADRAEMNSLYESCDAIITKPGGVTISEALNKGLPIFINHSLPGQEEYNLRFLQAKNLVTLLNQDESYSDQIQKVLRQPLLLQKKQAALKKYLQALTINPGVFIYKLLNTNHYQNSERGVYS